MQPNQPLGRLNALLAAHGASATPQPVLTNSQLQSSGSGAHSTGIGSIAGGIVGGIGGGLLGGGTTFGLGAAPGAIAGSGLGSALGEALEEGLTHHRVDLGTVGKEGALGLAGGAGGELLGAGMKAARGAGVLGKVAPSAIASNTGDALAVRSLRLTPSQLTNFSAKHGEDVTALLDRHGLQGADANGITKKIQPLQSAFDSIAKNQGLSVTKTDLRNTLAQRLQPLAESGASDDRTMAQQIKQEFDSYLKTIKGNQVSAGDLTKARQSYDKLTKSFNKAGDVFGTERNRSMGTVLRETLQGAADKAGLKGPNGQSFKNIGTELSKLYDLHGIAEKQANLGRGSLPLGITTLLGGGLGSLGGPGGTVGGALAGMALTKAVNSPVVTGMAAKGATGLGKALGEGGVLDTLGVGRQVAGRAGAGALMNASQAQPDLPPVAQQPASPQMGTSPGMGLSGALAASQPQSDPNDPFSQDNLQKLAMNDIQRTGGKNLSNILALQKLSSTPGAAKPVSSATNQQIANATSGLQQIQQLRDILGQNPNLTTSDAMAGLLPGAAGNFARGVAGTQSFNTARNEVVDVLARLRTGAAISKQEEEQYKNMLPTAGDSPQQIQQKLDIYERLFSGILQRSQAGDTPDLSTALAGL